MDESLRSLLLRRTQLLLITCLLAGLIFAGLELWLMPRHLPPPFYAKMFGITAITAGLVLLRHPWAKQHALSYAVMVVAAAYILTAVSGMVSQTREYATTAVLFVAGALTTAVALPWGIAAQCVAAGIGLLTLATAVIYADGNLGVLQSDPGVAILITFGISIVTAYQVNRYRSAHARELKVRREAEAAVRSLNRDLERRVQERTADLEAANERLAQETAERQHRQDELAHVLRVHTIGEMAAALAHEINQPLCAITNYAQGAAQCVKNGGLDPVALSWALDQIVHEGLRAGEIIRGVRNMVRREGGSGSVDLNALVFEALRVLESQARAHAVTVRCATAASVPLVRGDGTQLEQVILNLLLNAVEAVASSGNGRREVVISTAANGKDVEVTVSDSGPGLTAETIDHLFTPFFSTKAHGIGLGLVISRSIVEAHGGELTWQSHLAGGALFRFTLPAAAETTKAQ